jgi:hypothetical protein
MTPTYDNLRKAAAALGSPLVAGSPAEEVDALIDSARVNADDTVYVEHAAPESAWDAIFAGSLASLLAYGTSAAAKDFFRANGVIW